MKKLHLFIASFGLLLSSCNQSTTENLTPEAEHSSTIEHQHEDENEHIELNKGEKWIVDQNMITHIRAMENDLTSFDQEKQKNYSELAEKLQANIHLLTSNCTMTGKGHDELHKWLVPYMDLVQQLSEAQDKATASAHVGKLKQAFTTFNQFFE